MLIEVKDWKLDDIWTMDALTATLQVNRRGVRNSVPLGQAN
jgi:hypothetical protein